MVRSGSTITGALKETTMNLIKYINKKASWKGVIVLFCTSAVLGTLIITMCFNKITLDPDAAMDSLSFYTSDTFFKNLDAQGDAGRRGYLQLHLIDYLFITQFYLLLTFLLNLLLHKITNLKHLDLLCLIPLLSACMDLLENISIDISILLYPVKVIWLGSLAGIFTLIKISTIYITFILIVILSVLFLIKVRLPR